MSALTAILDIGKTNAKLLLSDAADGRVVWSAERPAKCPPRHPRVPCRELNSAGLKAWLLPTLAKAARIGPIDCVVPIAHGAALVVIGPGGEVLAAPDYEDEALATHRADYTRLRDDYAETLSPHLPLGLNLGQQLLHLEREAPALLTGARAILTWPQYWAWWLSGVAASELTSLGSHTDLWLPRRGCFSELAVRHGWARLFPPLRRADAVLGPIRPEIARYCGLDPACRVLCGMHDSSASYHALRESAETVISSGTWTIIMARAAALEQLQEARDMLANIDITGATVGVARAMGGREYASVAGPDAAVPTAEALAAVIEAGAMALPSFAAGGPFQGQKARLENAAHLDPTGRAALATLYLALLADEMLRLLGTNGRIIVDGPLAGNPLFGPVLQALRPTDSVLRSRSRDGVVIAANALARGRGQPLAVLSPAAGLTLAGLDRYHAAWRARVQAREG